MAENSNHEKLKLKLGKLEKEATKGKRAQKTLERKVTELDSFINNISDMAWIKDANSRFVAVNSAFGQAVGMDPESLIHQTCEICFGKEEAKKFQEDDMKVMRGRIQNVIEEKIIDSQNNEIWLETVKSPILDYSGRAVGTVGISRDITKRKRAEETLRQAHDKLERIVKERTSDLEKANEQLRLEIEERKQAEKEASYEQGLMQTLLDNIPDYVYFKDKNRRFVRASNFFCDLFGCSLEDIIGKKDEDLFPEEVAKETVSDDRQVIKTGIPLINKEEGGKSIGVGEHWVLTTKLPWRDKKGNIIGLFGISREITDRKRAEEALRKSKERYALATNVARVGVWDWNIQTNEFHLDPNVKAILGYSDADIPNNLEVWSNYVHPDDKQPVMEAFQNHIDGKTPEFVYEHRMLHKDGSICWIMARGTAIRDAQDNPVRVVGTDTDITQRKVAEEALRESEGKFRNLAEQSPNMIFINKSGKVVYANRKCEEITGYKRDEIHSDDFDFLKLIAPECIKVIKKNFKMHMSGGEVKPYEYTLISKSGKRIEAIITTKLIDYEGEKAILGIVTDITERKHAEKVLQEKDNKLERQTKNLEEVNVALKVLLEQREKEKIELKENILINIKKLIFPYVEKLEKKSSDEDSKVYVNIIKSNLEDLISPLAHTLSSKYFAFTPTEIQVTDLIKLGKTSKEIAAMLNVSSKAVSFHRGNIRKKLGLLNKKINLTSYLHSFPPIEHS
ncbi:MAG: PAS domain S-box protein [Candidatus Hodarchaeales archaeon]|jgi:PAS domain S-box-containing protein